MMKLGLKIGSVGNVLCRNDRILVHSGWQIVCSLTIRKVEHRYLWGAVQDELLSFDDKWVLRDHLNTARDVVNVKGKVVSHLEYNAFGRVVKRTGEEECVFGYTGKMFDVETGLQWNVNRWYDAEVGKWCSEDPIGFDGKDWNLARYVLNHTTIYLDSLGEKIIKKLYAIDGTCSGGCDAYDSWGVPVTGGGNGPFPDSNVKAMRDKARLKKLSGVFWEGPRQPKRGGDAASIHSGAVSTICYNYINEMNHRCNETLIYLVGWSRGGVIAVEVARTLGLLGCHNSKDNKYYYPTVEWVGLFDAVNQTVISGWQTHTTPYNVNKVSHAIKSDQNDFYGFLPTWEYSPRDEKRIFLYASFADTTHSDIGNGWIESGVKDDTVLDWMIYRMSLQGLNLY